ncbi:terminase large subunit domain-containing protein [Marinomonas transparens]|uniref:Terminase n=1 Tax=Marinomonas transparens TaxID=2795388 RepID=A0A934JRJ8_9GAMM|nr:terminase family protein [Marinomonas transparens]MBJ7536961.1 terminase [Marinomonas transparens]
MAHSQDTIDHARLLYIRAHKPSEIADRLNVSERTIFNWINTFNWKELLAFDTAEIEVSRRISTLTNRENKTKDEVQELASLCRIFGSMKQDLAKAEKIMAEAKAIADGKPEAVEGAISRSNRRGNSKKKTKAKNDISGIDVSKFDTWADKNLFEYQKLWRAVAHDPDLCRNRFILKSRQIGATYYFAWEAFEDAVKNGENQVFLSASKDQARIFKGYIQAFARNTFDIELKGQDSIELTKDGKSWATLYFLSTNSSTAQGYHGHLYVDEVFWIHGYAKLQKLASGMAAHKKWRRTYFSTPSSLQHPAYEHWSGAKFNKNRSRKVDIDLSDKTLKQGTLGGDKIWRHLVTVEDAEKAGCTLFDIDELKAEYSKADYENLFGCKFVDDNESVFPFSTLQKCMVDAYSKWTDVDFDSDNPSRSRPVAIGYDPSRIRDNAALVVVEIPSHYSQKWRVVETHQFKGITSEYQAARIAEIYQRYNVKWCGIDESGIGRDTFQCCLDLDLDYLVPILYSVSEKTDLVTRAKRLIDGGRVEYDTGKKELSQSLMMIHQVTTQNGSITYGAARSAETGHADLAWALFQAMQAEKQFFESKKSDDTNTETQMAIG